MAVTKVFDTSKDGIFNEDFGNVFKSAEGALVWELRQDTRPCRMPDTPRFCCFFSAVLVWPELKDLLNFCGLCLSDCMCGNNRFVETAEVLNGTW